MSIEKVRSYLQSFSFEDRIMEFEVSSATVAEASQALHLPEARIAKSLGFLVDDQPVIIVMAGDAKIDNASYRHYFHCKAKMLSFDQVQSLTGHSVGGVCPFALPEHVKVYLDESLRRFETVFPAAGSSNSAVELTCSELQLCSSNFAAWVDITKGWREQ